MSTFLIIALSSVALYLVIILLVYFCGKKNRKTFLVSSIIESQELEGLHYYYLPSASLTIHASAEIVLYKSLLSGKVIKADLIRMNCEVTSKIEPDTTHLVTIAYNPDFFFSDELKIVTDDRGLLQSIDSITEDTIGHIVEQFTNAPKEALNVQKSLLYRPFDSPEETIEMEQIILTRSFYIPASSVDEPEITCSWFISFNGTAELVTLDASFNLKRHAFKAKYNFAKPFFYEGIITRSVTEAVWDIEVPGSKEIMNDGIQGAHNASQPVIKLSCMIPDISRIIKIPMQRTAFVALTAMPKFSEGLLVENTIKKPSELAESAKIPIHILKSLVSIPAQLFQFKIIRNHTEADFEKSIKHLLLSKEESRSVLDAKHRKALKLQLNGLRQAIAERPDPSTLQKIWLPELPISKLGKLPPKDVSDPEAALLKDNKLLNFVGHLTAGAFSVPPAMDWSSQLNGSFLSYNNFKLLTCVPAAAAYLITVWTAHTRNVPMIPSLQSVMKAYQEVSHYDPAISDSDKGCNLYDFLAHWRDKGLGADKIEKFTSLQKQNVSLLKLVISWFGGGIIGLQMPSSAKNKLIWGESPAGSGESDIPGSWGGHAVAVVGYDSKYLIAISSGLVIRMTYAFYEKYNDESFIVLSSADWLKDGMTPTDPQLTLAQLKQKIKDIIS
jgi:hypothetical protein